MLWLFYFAAPKYGNISRIGSADKLSVFIAVILSVLFLGEQLPLPNAAGVVMIAAGALLVAMK